MQRALPSALPFTLDGGGFTCIGLRQYEPFLRDTAHTPRCPYQTQKSFADNVCTPAAADDMSVCYATHESTAITMQRTGSPATSVNLPAGHAVHAVAPTSGWKVPAGTVMPGTLVPGMTS